MGEQEGARRKEASEVTSAGLSMGYSGCFDSAWMYLAVFLLAAIVFLGFWSTRTNGIEGSDDREYASIARNIAAGKGIVKQFVYPVDVNVFNRLPAPEFLHAVGYPLLIAGFFKVFGVSDSVALFPSYLAFFSLVFLFYFFAKRHTNAKSAALGAAILIFNKDLLDVSLVALSEPIYVFIFFLFFVRLWRARTTRDLFIAGLFFGFSHVIRFNVVPFLPVLLVYVWLFPGDSGSRWKGVGVFAAGCLIPIVPTLVRAYLETGSPFFSYGKFLLLLNTARYPWETCYLNIENPSFLEFFKDYPGQFFLKYSDNMITQLSQLLTITNPYLLAGCLFEMFYWKVGPDAKRSKILFLLLFAAQILFVPAVSFVSRYFLLFIPVMAFFAAQGFLRLAENAFQNASPPGRKRMAILFVGLFLIFFALPTAYSIIRPNGPPELESKAPQLGFLALRDDAERLNRFISQEVKSTQIIWTDLPEVLEWEGDRSCGWIPFRIKTLYEIDKKIPVDAVLLTNARTPFKMAEEWQYLLFSEHSLPQFRTVKLFKGRTLFAKLLVRDGKD